MLSAVLSFTLLLTLVSGVSMRLYELTSDSSDLYQRNAFDGLLIAVIGLCVLLSVASIVLSTKCLRRRVIACRNNAKKRTELVPAVEGNGGAEDVGEEEEEKEEEEEEDDDDDDEDPQHVGVHVAQWRMGPVQVVPENDKQQIVNGNN